ncbi:hypothetical protein Cfor_11849 [Coptotermes formosanus]|uniref:Uncharacterized protein n=1 Tax=Coptotermes formosanus TaxID=36987 RepID=A0A6L2Q1B7_COPFO|nr:hypothetical protein Cfor_11849 [Coptotermes formosanus]
METNEVPKMLWQESVQNHQRETAERDQSKFSKGKYNRNHQRKDYSLFSGEEQETGKTFLVAMHGRRVTEIVKEGIPPGTTTLSYCWESCNALKNEEYTH